MSKRIRKPTCIYPLESKYILSRMQPKTYKEDRLLDIWKEESKEEEGGFIYVVTYNKWITFIIQVVAC